MIRIQTEKLPNKDEIYSFLKHTKYRNFNLWSNVTDENIAKFLFEELNRIQSTSKIFIATQDSKIIALLSLRNLDWDSKHYGFKCAMIEYVLTNKTLDNSIIQKSVEQILAEFQKFCIKSEIKFVFVSIDSWDFVTSVALQKANFRYILTWIDGIFKAFDTLPEIIDGGEIGIIKPEDIDYFKRISSVDYFKGGRFYSDPNFDKQLVDKMYANLIEYSFKNNDIMLVYRIKNRPVGLFIYKKIVTYKNFSNLRVTSLRYFIIDAEFRNKKVARNFFAKTLTYLKDNCDLITTGLEIHNLLSLNLHSRLGFKFTHTHNVFHWWNQYI